MQILMSVLMVHTTVIKSVQTVMAPSPVPVTVDIHCQMIEDHALVCMHFIACNIRMVFCRCDIEGLEHNCI